MKKLILIFFGMILLVLINPALAEDRLSPKKQIEQGVFLTEIKCDKGLDLAFKKSNGIPICITPNTLEILNQRNWITKHNVSNSNIDQLKPIIKSVDANNPQNIVNSSNRFMLDFYSKTNKSDENSFFSPWSLLSAFSVLYEAARGETADEIATVFYLPKNDDTRRDSFESMQDNLNINGSGYELRNVNALWLQTGFKVKEDFVNTAKQYYGSKVSEVTFPTDEQMIDSWVEEMTNDKIKDLVKGRTSGDTRAVITNAVYFKGTWKTQFESQQTDESEFRVDEKKTVQVPMMHMKSKFAYTETNDLQILSLPYKGEKMSMLVLLPKNNIESLDKSITIETLEEWNSQLQEQDVELFIPKFTLETSYELPEIMKSMGIKLAFGDADLSGMTDRKLYVSDAVHKAFVDVNEEGTEAAAATAIIMDEEAEPIQPVFKADHPFIFLIQDSETGLILFMGKVIDPTTS